MDNNTKVLLKKIIAEYAKFESLRSKQVKIIANVLYSELPERTDKFIKVIDSLLDEDDKLIFPLMTLWIKRIEAMIISILVNMKVG